MDMKNLPLWQWTMDIETLQHQGVMICPLMFREPGRFPAKICACDIPGTRETFLTRHPRASCHHGTHCMPSLTMQILARNEIAPFPAKTNRPRKRFVVWFQELKG